MEFNLKITRGPEEYFSLAPLTLNPVSCLPLDRLLAEGLYQQLTATVFSSSIGFN